jgi:hypothetical protein
MANPAARLHPAESGLRPQLQGMIVACRVVFLMAALGFGTAALPDSLHMNKLENYPAAKLVALDTASAEAKSMDAKFDELDVVRSYQAPGQHPVVFGSGYIPEKPRRWWRIEKHQYLGKVLPDAEFYVVMGSQGRNGLENRGYDWLMAISHGRLYELPKELDQLLYDNGMTFARADAQTWARTATLVWACVTRQELWYYGWRATGERIEERRDYWDLPAIPAVEFDDVQVDLDTGEKVLVHLVCDGVQQELRISVVRVWLGVDSSARVGIVPFGMGTRGGGVGMPPQRMSPPSSQSRLDGEPNLDQRDR